MIYSKGSGAGARESREERVRMGRSAERRLQASRSASRAGLLLVPRSRRTQECWNASGAGRATAFARPPRTARPGSSTSHRSSKHAASQSSTGSSTLRAVPQTRWRYRSYHFPIVLPRPPPPLSAVYIPRFRSLLPRLEERLEVESRCFGVGHDCIAGEGREEAGRGDDR